MAAEWINTEPGVLVLSGTVFSVRYDAKAKCNLFYVVYRDGVRANEFMTLQGAKEHIEYAQSELAEIGLG